MAATAARWNIPAQLQPVRFEAFDPAQGRNAVAKTTYKVANFVLPYLETIVNKMITYFNAALQIADRLLNGQFNIPAHLNPDMNEADKSGHRASAPETPTAAEPASPIERKEAPAVNGLAVVPFDFNRDAIAQPAIAANLEVDSKTFAEVEESVAPATPVATDAAHVEESVAPATLVATDAAHVEESSAPATPASERADANEPDHSNPGAIVTFFRWATGYSAADSE